MAENKTQRNLKQLKDFKVVSERKLIAEQLTGFDCQHCDNIISIGSSTPNGLNVKFANHVTGNTQEVLLPTFPNVAPLTQTSEWAKFGHLFWIKYNSSRKIHEFQILPDCEIVYNRTIDIPLAITSIGSGMCAKGPNSLIIGSAIVQTPPNNPNFSSAIVEIDITVTNSPTYNVLLYNVPPVAGDIVYLPPIGISTQYSNIDTIAYSNTIGGSGSSAGNSRVLHYDISGTVFTTNNAPPFLGQAPISSPAFSLWSFYQAVYAGVNGGLDIERVNIAGYYSFPYSVNTGPHFNDAAATPLCEPGIVIPCYYLGDVGPGGGIIFSVPLGHPQNNGVNQSNFYYEVEQNDIDISGTPVAAFNNDCGENIAYGAVLDVNDPLGGSYFANSTAQVGSNILKFDPADPANAQLVSLINSGTISTFTLINNQLNLAPYGTNIIAYVFNGNASITNITVTPNLITITMSANVDAAFPVTTTTPVAFLNPVTTPGFATVGSEFGVNNKFIQTSTSFGSGLNNTNALHAYPLSPGNPTGGIHPYLDTHDIAATKCKNHSSTGTYLGEPFTAGDWFLPSLGEFEELVYQYEQGNINLNFSSDSFYTNGVYWTSSAYRSDNVTTPFLAPSDDRWAFCYHMNTTNFGPTPINTAYASFRCHTHSVRPIRRFECDPDPCTYTNDCNCVEYNYRDGIWMANHNMQAGGYVGNMGQSSGPIPGTTDTDSWLGGNEITIALASKDVKGNEFNLTDWEDDSIGYTITVWDRQYSYLGTWKYDNYVVDNTPGINWPTGQYPHTGDPHPLLPDAIVIHLEGVTHIDGPSPYVNYLEPASTFPSFTRAFFKIEAACNTNNPNAFESGCNVKFSSQDMPTVCLLEEKPPQFDITTVTSIQGLSFYNGGQPSTCVPSYGTFNTIPNPSTPTYYPGQNLNFSIPTCNSDCEYCDYQIGDIGPGGGIIVALPYMNIKNYGPDIPGLQGSGAVRNDSNYFYEVSPHNLNLDVGFPVQIGPFSGLVHTTPPGSGVTGAGYQNGNPAATGTIATLNGWGNIGQNMNLITDYTTPDQSILQYFGSPQNDLHFPGQGEQLTQDVMSNTQGQVDSVFPGLQLPSSGGTLLNPWSQIITQAYNAGKYKSAFKICSQYKRNNYTDWFLPNPHEMAFARNYLVENTAPVGGPPTPGSLYDSMGVWLNINPDYIPLYWTSLCSLNTGSADNTDLFNVSQIDLKDNNGISVNDPNFGGGNQGVIVNTLLNPANQGFAVPMTRLPAVQGNQSPGIGAAGTFDVYGVHRGITLNVRAMRKFECTSPSIGTIVSGNVASKVSSNDPRSLFRSKKRKLNTETGPFGINGYYPLFDNIDSAENNSPDSSGYHIHEFEGVEYYMPNGLEMDVTQFHGNWPGFERKKLVVNKNVLPPVTSYDITNEIPDLTEQEQTVTPVQEQPSVVTITPIQPDQDDEEPPTTTPTYTPPSTPSGGSGGGGY